MTSSRHENSKNKSPNENSGDDLFGDMDVDFASSPTTAQPSTHAETAPLSNVSELGDLVLTSHMSANAGEFFFLSKKQKLSLNLILDKKVDKIQWVTYFDNEIISSLLYFTTACC